MKSKHHVNIIIFTITIQIETLTSDILDNIHIHTSMCVTLNKYIIHEQIHTNIHTL